MAWPKAIIEAETSQKVRVPFSFPPKCDIEGSERELFNDCRQWIHRVNHLIVEVHDKSYHLPELYADLKRNGWHYEITAVKDGYICFLKRVGLE